MKTLYRAVAYRDHSEGEYITGLDKLLDKLFETKAKAQDALDNTFANIKFIKEMQVE